MHADTQPGRRTRGLHTSCKRRAVGQQRFDLQIRRFVARCRDLDTPITVTTYTHQPSDFASGFTEAAALLRDLRITHVIARDGDRWIPRPVN